MILILNQHKRSAVSPVIATLLLIAIAVAAAIIVYAFVTGLIGGLTGGSSGLIVESGTLSIPTGTATDGTPTSYGSLVLTIKNDGAAPIASVTVTENSDTAICDSAKAVCTNWSGTVLTPTWAPLTQAMITAGTASAISTSESQSFTTPITGGTDSANAGTTYTYTVTVTFTTGTGNNVQVLSLDGQT